MKENFNAFWEARDFASMALLAPDLPGHGASQGLPLESSTMEKMAIVVHDLLQDRVRETERLHIVAHSMGGAVGLLIAKQTPIPLASFVNVEGNLVADDCGMLSRRTAGMDLKVFRNEIFGKLKARARDSDDPSLRDWANWVEACTAEAFHIAARSLVEWSDSGQLLDIFQALPVRKIYVYGEHSANPEVLARLEDIPKYRIADCGHFVMIEKSIELLGVVFKEISQTK